MMMMWKWKKREKYVGYQSTVGLAGGFAIYGGKMVEASSLQGLRTT